MPHELTEYAKKANDLVLAILATLPTILAVKGIQESFHFLFQNGDQRLLHVHIALIDIVVGVHV